MKILRKDLVVLAVLGVIGFSLYFHQKSKAFPSSNLRLKVHKGEAEELASSFLKNLGVRKIETAYSSTKFWSFDSALIFFEKEVGQQKAYQWINQQKLPVWGWETRFFWPGDLAHEYQVFFSTEGDFVGFEKKLFNDEQVSSLSPDQALKLAGKKAAELYPTEFQEYSLVQQSSEELIKRTDYSFKWERKESPLRTRQFISITISGDEPSWILKELDTPADFNDKEKGIESRQTNLRLVTEKINSLVTLVIVLSLLFFWKRRWIRWKSLLPMAVLSFSLYLLNYINGLPLTWHSFTNDKTLTAFWSHEVFSSMFEIVISTGWLFVLLVAADVMLRLDETSKYSFSEISSRKFYSTKSFLISALSGLSLLGVHLGFVTLYYLLGRNYFHFFSPMEIPYTNLLTTKLPFLSPILSGFHPSLMEESIYRVFVTVLLIRLVKYRWVAALFPSLLWGFLHTAYYVEPIYARGLELSIVGLIYCWVYFRFGIFATLVSHFFYNFIISSDIFLNSDIILYQVGIPLIAVALLFPIVRSVWLYMNGSLISDIPFTRLSWRNENIKSIATDFDRRNRSEPKILRSFIMQILGILASVLILVRIFLMVHPSTNFNSREQSQKVAQEILSKIGYDTEGWKFSSYFVRSEIDPDTLNYVKRNLHPLQALEWETEQKELKDYWRLTWISPDSPFECTVHLYTDDVLESLSCIWPENEVESNPTLKESHAIAERFARSQPVTFQNFRYISGEEKQVFNHRRDSTHKWVDTTTKIGELRRILTVSLAGRKISHFSLENVIPDSFINESTKMDLFSVVKKIALVLIVFFSLTLILRAFFDRVVLSRFYSSGAMIVAIFFSFLYLLNELNQSAYFWDNFIWTTPVSHYVFRKAFLTLGKVLFWGSAAYMFSILFFRLPPQIFKEAPSRSDLAHILKRPPWRWRQTQSMFWWGLALASFTGFFRYWIDQELIPYNILNTNLPILYLPIQVVFQMGVWILFAILISACKKYLWNGVTPWIVFLLVLSTTILNVERFPTAWFQFFHSAFIFVMVCYVIAFRLPFYFWYSVWLLSFQFLPLILNKTPFFKYQGWIVVVIVISLSLITFLPKKPGRA